MNEGVVHILKAGGSDTVVQQFKDLIETERFNGLSISKRLSLILTVEVLVSVAGIETRLFMNYVI